MNLDEAKRLIDSAYSIARDAINGSIKYAEEYIVANPITSNVYNVAFSSAMDELAANIDSITSHYINEAFIGFTTRSQNISIDFRDSASTEDAEALSKYISEFGDSLQTLSDGAVSDARSLVELHLTDRPLIRATGERSYPIVKFDVPLTFSQEVQNVGKYPWSGWLCITLTDMYKKSVTSNVSPPNIPILNPGETAILTQSIVIPQYVNLGGKSLKWAGDTKVRSSIYTRKL